jgi:hypothetical protein
LGGCSSATSSPDRCSPPPPPPWWTARHPLRRCPPWPCLCPYAVRRPIPRAHHAVSGEALTRATETPRRSTRIPNCTLWSPMEGGWSDLHLSLSGRCLIALLLLDQLRAHALRRLPRLRGVLPSRLSCTLPARSRLLCACGVFELPQHLRHLMMTALVADLEGGDSTNRLSTDGRAHLRQRLDRLHVPVACRLVKRRRSIISSFASFSASISRSTRITSTCPSSAAR